MPDYSHETLVDFSQSEWWEREQEIERKREQEIEGERKGAQGGNPDISQTTSHHFCHTWSHKSTLVECRGDDTKVQVTVGGEIGLLWSLYNCRYDKFIWVIKKKKPVGGIIGGYLGVHHTRKKIEAATGRGGKLSSGPVGVSVNWSVSVNFAEAS